MVRAHQKSHPERSAAERVPPPKPLIDELTRESRAIRVGRGRCSEHVRDPDGHTLRRKRHARALSLGRRTERDGQGSPRSAGSDRGESPVHRAGAARRSLATPANDSRARFLPARNEPQHRTEAARQSTSRARRAPLRARPHPLRPPPVPRRPRRLQPRPARHVAPSRTAAPLELVLVDLVVLVLAGLVLGTFLQRTRSRSRH